MIRFPGSSGPRLTKIVANQDSAIGKPFFGTPLLEGPAGFVEGDRGISQTRWDDGPSVGEAGGLQEMVIEDLGSYEGRPERGSPQ